MTFISELLDLVEKHSVNGVVNWNKIGQIISLRSKTQCYNRFQTLKNTLNCRKGKFTSQENKLILKFVAEHGPDSFDQMGEDFLEGRSVFQIKCHYNVSLNNTDKIHPWTHEEDKLLVDFVETEGTNNWKGIAEILKNHNRISCRTRYQTIIKYLQKNPNACVEDVPIKAKKMTAAEKAKATNEVDDKSMNEIVSKPTKTSFDKFREDNPEMVKLMSTAFKLDFGKREVNVDNEKVLVLMKLFNVKSRDSFEKIYNQVTTNQIKKFKEIFELQINNSLLKEILFTTKHVKFMMPPNYNTAIGLRAVIIKLQELEDTGPNIFKKPSSNYVAARQSFIEFYFSLFYWTAMLQKLDISELSIYTQMERSTRVSDIIKYISKQGKRGQLKRTTDPTSSFGISKRFKASQELKQSEIFKESE